MGSLDDYRHNACVAIYRVVGVFAVRIEVDGWLGAVAWRSNINRGTVISLTLGNNKCQVVIRGEVLV